MHSRLLLTKVPRCHCLGIDVYAMQFSGLDKLWRCERLADSAPDVQYDPALTGIVRHGPPWVSRVPDKLQLVQMIIDHITTPGPPLILRSSDAARVLP